MWRKGFVARPDLLRIQLQSALVSDRRKIIAVQHHDLATCQRRLDVVLDILTAVLQEPFQFRGWQYLLSAMLSQVPQLLPPCFFVGLFTAYEIIACLPQAV